MIIISKKYVVYAQASFLNVIWYHISIIELGLFWEISVSHELTLCLYIMAQLDRNESQSFLKPQVCLSRPVSLAK